MLTLLNHAILHPRSAAQSIAMPAGPGGDVALKGAAPQQSSLSWGDRKQGSLLDAVHAPGDCIDGCSAWQGADALELIAEMGLNEDRAVLQII